MAERDYRITVEQTVRSYTIVTAETAAEARDLFEGDPYGGDFYGEESVTSPEVTSVEPTEEPTP